MLFLDIRRNQKLAAKRSPMFEKNRFAKLLMYSGIAFWAAYLLLLGVMLPFAFRESFTGLEPYHVLDKILVCFLVLDFLLRFVMPTPVQEIKPFLLLPVRRKKVMAIFLIQEGLHPVNLFWLCFFVPFALISIRPFYGLTGVAGYAVGIWMLMVLNGYWSMLVRVLKRQRFAHLLWTIPVYGMLALLEFCPDEGLVSRFTLELGECFIQWKGLAFLGIAVCIFGMAVMNYRIQLHLIYKELCRKDDNGIRRISTYRIFDRYGNTGEYMKLELKMIFRNKTPRSQFWSFIVLMCLFALALSVEAYGEGSYMNNFICLYCFSSIGLMTLNQVMATEGNYIDGLMVRKESIYCMLCAKYYLQCMLLVIPLAFCLIPVIRGTIPLLMPLAYLFFTPGVVFAIMMQMAVYNNKTLPLHTGMMGRKPGNSMYQSLTVLCAFSVPLLLCKAVTLLLDETTAYGVLIALGVAGMALHRYWIRNIYVRLMKRKYQNMEGFRNTR